MWVAGAVGRPPSPGYPAAVRQPPNLTAASDGQDYGAYDSDAFNKAGGRGAERLRPEPRPLPCRPRRPQLGGRDVTLHPAGITKFYMLHGSDVTPHDADPVVQNVCTQTWRHRRLELIPARTAASAVATGGHPTPGVRGPSGSSTSPGCCSQHNLSRRHYGRGPPMFAYVIRRLFIGLMLLGDELDDVPCSERRPSTSARYVAARTAPRPDRARSNKALG